MHVATRPLSELRGTSISAAGRARCCLHALARKMHTHQAMNLTTWLPAMFLLGLVSMGLCIAFVKACEVI
jgi:hypothetical protein